MIVCTCGTENKTLKNPRYWADILQHIGECNGCQTSIHFQYKENGEIERAKLTEEQREQVRKNIRRAIRNVA